MKKESARVRIAPSPTGPFHIGTARTALFNYLFAKKNKGSFILRIEDTDKDRSKPEFEKDIMIGLQWLGLKWDEKPYRQSERTEIYKKYINKLLGNGSAYYCFPNRVICFKTTHKKLVFNDLIRGEVAFDTALFDDFIIAKDVSSPLYNLAAVIDDYEMKITHIIRGEDHISNTPKQILLQEALGFDRPQYAHLPLILGPDRSKLSKRHGATSLNQYRDLGYLPEAINNFVALLGWNPGTDKEIFSLKELEKEFSLERVGKSGAIFNIEKLNWLNGYYIKKMSTSKLSKLINKDKRIIKLFQKRLKTLKEIDELSNFFFKEKLEYDPKLLTWKQDTKSKTLSILKELQNLYEAKPHGELKKILELLAKKFTTGSVFWPLRVALSGQKTSPDPLAIAKILDKKKVLQRINEAIQKLQ